MQRTNSYFCEPRKVDQCQVDNCQVSLEKKNKTITKNKRNKGFSYIQNASNINISNI